MMPSASPKLVRGLAAVRRADADPGRPVRLDRRHAAVRRREPAPGDPRDGADFAVPLRLPLPPGAGRFAPDASPSGSATTAAISASPSPSRTPSTLVAIFCSAHVRATAGLAQANAATRSSAGPPTFLAAMTATSFDRTAQLIGPRAFRILHLTGGYYLLFQFMVSFGKRIPGHAALRAVPDPAGSRCSRCGMIAMAAAAAAAHAFSAGLTARCLMPAASGQAAWR